MTKSFENIRICGIAASVPSHIEENSLAMGILGERRCKKQIKMTGVERRHVSEIGQTISDLCYPAAKKLMEHLNWEPESIKVLILVTQSQNYRTPSTAFLLHKLLGLSNDCIVFDVNLGCSAFSAGIEIVSSLLQRFPGCARGICLQGDLAYESIHEGAPPDVVADNMLFGSAGSGVAIEKTADETEAPVFLDTKSDGNRYRAILRPLTAVEPLQMDGEAVFAFSISDVAEGIQEFRKEHHLSEEDIDYYVFHQAQKLILDTMASICEIRPEKELRSLRDFGNTSGSSVPLSICANRDMLIAKEHTRICCCGFGVGLTWSTVYFQILTENILPLIITDRMFER